MKVWNKRDKNVPKDVVYVGRPTKWGNPFSHQNGTLAKYKVATREEAVEKYRQYLLHLELNDPNFWEDISPLKGKDLVCWCAPEACHADILLKKANESFIDSPGAETILCSKDCPLCVHDDKCKCSTCIWTNYE